MLTTTLLGGRFFNVISLRSFVKYSFVIRSAKILFRYQSTVLGSYQTVELIETFMNYQVLFKIMSTM